MALNEDEEFELLSLERERAMAGTAKPQKGRVRRAAEAVVGSPALPVAGGMVGGIAGLPLGPGALGTAALGGAAGEAYRQIAARGLGMDAPQTSMGAAADIGIEGLMQGVAQGTGQYVLGPAARYGLKSAGKLGKQAVQLVTKVRPEDTERVFRNPGSMLPGTMKKAKANWDKAADKAGIKTGEGAEIETIKRLKGDAAEFVGDAYEQLLSGQTITAKAAHAAKQAIDVSLMPAAKTQRNKPLIALWSKVRSKFMDKIAEESPELAAANREMSKAFSADRFKSLFPKNLDQSPAMLRTAMLSGLGFGLGSGDPLKAAATVGLASPMSVGTGVALAGTLARPGRVIAPYLGRAALGFGASRATGN